MPFSTKFRVPLSNLTDAVESQCGTLNVVIDDSKEVDGALNRIITSAGLSDIQTEAHRATFFALDSTFGDPDCVAQVGISSHTIGVGDPGKTRLHSAFTHAVSKLQELLTL